MRSDEGKARSSKDATKLEIYSAKCKVRSSSKRSASPVDRTGQRRAHYKPIGTTEVNLVEEFTLVGLGKSA